MKKGMTLVEILVAALITSMGITSMMMSFVTCKKIVDRNTKRYQATVIADKMFEGIQRRTNKTTVADFINMYPSGSPIVGDIYDYTSGGSSNFYLKFDTSTTVNPSATSNLILVNLRVSWDREYIDGDTNNAVNVQMITNDPYSHN